MKVFLSSVAFVSIFSWSTAFSKTPDPVVTFTDTANGFAVIAGKLVEAPKAPVGVKVENGGIAYSTVSDPEGRWSVVIRHRAYNYSVNTFDLQNADKSGLIELRLQN